MNIRQTAEHYLRDNHPELISREIEMRASKYHENEDLWFFTFPIDYFDLKWKDAVLAMLLQQKIDKSRFHVLKVPFSFFREQEHKFSIRRPRTKFDLHISAKKYKWLVDDRSKGKVSFKDFEVKY